MREPSFEITLDLFSRMHDPTGKTLERMFCPHFPKIPLFLNHKHVRNGQVMTVEIFSGMVFAINKRQGSTDNKYGAFD